MPNYLVQISLWPTSNLQADASVGNWSCSATTDAEASNFAAAVIDVYRGLQSYFAGIVRQTDNTYKIYDRSDPIPRTPILEGTWNFLGMPSGDPLPPEVALCMSFQAVPLSGVKQASRRGRIYLGPWDVGSLGTDGRPSAAHRTAVNTAGAGLLAASVSAANWDWNVWSPTLGSGSVVNNGWVDNEFDTQRSRGRKATARDTFV